MILVHCILTEVWIPVLPDAVYQLPQGVPCEYRDILCPEPHQDVSEILQLSVVA